MFFSGAIAASLTHPEDEEQPGFVHLARHISYGKLIAVDLLFVLMMVLGTIAFIVPGILVFVYLSLAGPVVELEKRSVWDGFRRSFRLVRGHFWMAAGVLSRSRSSATRSTTRWSAPPTTCSATACSPPGSASR